MDIDDIRDAENRKLERQHQKDLDLEAEKNTILELVFERVEPQIYDLILDVINEVQAEKGTSFGVLELANDVFDGL